MNKLILTAIFIACLSLVIPAQNDSKIIKNANETLAKGNINGAIAVLTKAIEKNNGSFEIYRQRSILYEMTGNLQGQFDDLTKAIELRSTDGELYQRRALARMFLGRNVPDNQMRILNDLDLAIANKHKVEKVYNLRGMFRHQTGDLDGALSDYQTASGLNPDSAAAVLGLSSIYRAKVDKPQAIMILENFLSKYEYSLKKMPTVEGKVVAQTDVIVAKEENFTAGSNSVIIVIDDDNSSMPPSPIELRKQTEKLENSKNTAQLYSTLATLYNERGDHEKALDAVTKAMTIDPTESQSFAVRGNIKASMKDYAGAYKDLTHAINASPSFPFNYEDRGIVLIYLNRDAEAQKDFDKFYNVISHPAARKRLEENITEAKRIREVNTK